MKNFLQCSRALFTHIKRPFSSSFHQDDDMSAALGSGPSTESSDGLGRTSDEQSAHELLDTLANHLRNMDAKLDRLNRLTDQLEQLLKRMPATSGGEDADAAGCQTANPARLDGGDHQKPPIVDMGPPRLPNGRLDIYSNNNLRGYATTQQEKLVINAMPDAVLPSEAAYFPKCEANTVVIPSNLRLVWADDTVIDKLSEIQRELQRALVPYELWPSRVASELAGDFQLCQEFARFHRIDWVTFLESIIEVLQDHHVLYRPVVNFATLLPC